MRYRLHTLLMVMALWPPLMGLTYHLTTGWLFRVVADAMPDIDHYDAPLAGGWRYSVGPDGAVSDK